MKLEQATIHNTKVGDKCYIEVNIENIKYLEVYPIKAGLMSFTQNGKYDTCKDTPQLYHIIQEEIPTLGEGVEMEVGSDGVYFIVQKIIAISKDGYYIDSDLTQWSTARPIKLTLEQKYENALKEIEELKKQLNK